MEWVERYQQQYFFITFRIYKKKVKPLNLRKANIQNQSRSGPCLRSINILRARIKSPLSPSAHSDNVESSRTYSPMVLILRNSQGREKLYKTTLDNDGMGQLVEQQGFLFSWSHTNVQGREILSFLLGR